MTFVVSAGADSSLKPNVAFALLGAAKACSCEADWAAFKKDKSYDHYMRSHRVKVGKMEAVAPPGGGGTVKHMKEHHPNISNPYALSWYQYEKGDKFHKKAPKGTGAKHVSKEVKEKRAKSLKAGGPGSGRRSEVFSKYGWKPSGKSYGQPKYTHPNHPGHEIVDDRNGQWPHENRYGNSVAFGDKTSELRDHLSQLSQRYEVSGHARVEDHCKEDKSKESLRSIHGAGKHDTLQQRQDERRRSG